MTAAELPIKATPVPKVRLTEKDMLKLLRARYTASGNGGAGEYAFMAQVRNAAGFDATRTFDAVVMSLWRSRGFEIHAFEIKCSRRDWLREVKDPAKAEAAANRCDRFWMVMSDDEIIRDGELPSTWGLMIVRGGKLVIVKEAPLLPEADTQRPISRSWLVSLLRSAGAVPKVEVKEIQDARNEGYERGLEYGKQRLDMEQATVAELRGQISSFEREAHMRFGQWNGHDPAEIGQAVRAVLAGDDRVAGAQQRIVAVREQLLRAAESLEPFITEREPTQ